MVDERKRQPEIAVELSGVRLDNPVIPASGTFGYGREFSELYDINILGSISFKGTTPEPRFGNPQPRIAECREGLLNSVGLQNPGLDRVIAEELPALRKIFKKPLIANICGSTIDDYVKCAAAMDREASVGIIEVNVSCPNVREGGMAFGQDAEQAAAVTREVRKAVAKPVYVKLSPNVTDITLIARACEAAGADGLCLINTLLGMRIDIRKRTPVIGNKVGGFSGPAVFPVAVRMVWQTAHCVDIPVIGAGGISTADDVLEMIFAGAEAVEVGTANLVDPWACEKIIRELPVRMEELGIGSLGEIRGTV